MLGHYKKDFDAWNTRKQIIERRNPDRLPYVKEREIWWMSVGVNVGSEIDGKHDLFERPVLVISKIGNTKFFGVPITSQEKSGTFFVPVNYDNRIGIAVIADFRSFSTK